MFQKKVNRYRLWNRNKIQNFIKLIKLSKQIKRFKKTKVISEQDQLQYDKPCKIVNHEVPIFNFPQNVQVFVHDKKLLSYNTENPLIKLSSQQFFNHKGKLKLSVAQMQISNYNIPKIVAKTLKTIKKVNLWAYNNRRVTGWHYDGHDNFLYTLKGTKIIYLLPPNTIKPNNMFSLYNNHIDPQSKLSQYKDCIQKTKVNQNTCLYIPRGWWHHVISIGQPNIAINYWGNSLAQIKYTQYEITLRHICYQISQNFCMLNIQNWEELDQQVKTLYRYSYFNSFLKSRLI